MKWWVLTERNDWEGETWTRYIAEDTEGLDLLRRRFEVESLDSGWSLREFPGGDETVFEEVIHSQEGYMHSDAIALRLNPPGEFYKMNVVDADVTIWHVARDRVPNNPVAERFAAYVRENYEFETESA